MIYIALVRGINVGRAKQVPMADLRAAVEALGFEDVRTLLRSGNVVFKAPKASTSTIGRRVEEAIESLGTNARVVIRTVDELARAIEANPLPSAAAHGSQLHVMFLEEPLAAAP